MLDMQRQSASFGCAVLVGSISVLADICMGGVSTHSGCLPPWAWDQEILSHGYSLGLKDPSQLPSFYHLESSYDCLLYYL